jgi:hypothetical protein
MFACCSIRGRSQLAGRLGATMKAAVYARGSTVDQNCELQLRELRDYTVRHGWEIAGEYIDTGWSGAKAGRPEFDKLMQDAAKRKFDMVLACGVPAAPPMCQSARLE